MSSLRYQGLVADMDGVLTRTAHLHQEAWRRVFDDVLERRAGAEASPFSEQDYLRFVDGKPRYEGARAFLESREVDLPEGDPSDSPEQETICGVGNRKNTLFLQLLEEHGAEVFRDVRPVLERWRREGLRLAVATASRNGRRVLERAGLLERFDARVDGVAAAELGLSSKQEILLEAAAQLGVAPPRAALLEDAVAGVRAARQGGFGLVVGVARERTGDELLEAGADLTVADLTRLELSRIPLRALDGLPEIEARVTARPPAVFLDYDGTLTPIVDDPEQAWLADRTRAAVERLAALCPVGVVSGRDRGDVRRRVGIEGIYYAGSHGFAIDGPDREMRLSEAAAARPALDEAETALRDRATDLSGVQLERKDFALAVHYRRAAVPAAEVERAVDEVARRHPELRKRSGKKVFELQPDVDWDKGRAVIWLCEALGIPAERAVYVGDDLTDEDAFRALAERGGLGVCVGARPEGSRADYRLRHPGEVRTFLERIADALTAPRST